MLKTTIPVREKKVPYQFEFEVLEKKVVLVEEGYSEVDALRNLKITLTMIQDDVIEAILLADSLDEEIPTQTKPKPRKVIANFKKPASPKTQLEEPIETQMGVVINHPKKVNNPGFQPKHGTSREPVD